MTVFDVCVWNEEHRCKTDVGVFGNKKEAIASVAADQPISLVKEDEEYTEYRIDGTPIFFRIYPRNIFWGELYEGY